jgi:hypothetical protein
MTNSEQFHSVHSSLLVAALASGTSPFVLLLANLLLFEFGSKLQNRWVIGAAIHACYQRIVDASDKQ